MKTDPTNHGTFTQEMGSLKSTNHSSPALLAGAMICRKRFPCLERSRRSGLLCAVTVGVTLVASALQAQIHSSNSFNDDHWNSLGAMESLTDGIVYATAMDPSGDLYIGGAFTHVGNMPARGIAKWDGTTWSSLGSGVLGNVYDLVWFGNSLYVGGNFAKAGDLPTTDIAMWNGSTWENLGSGISGEVRAITILDNHLYAGGLFSSAGGVPARNIARWDGVNWEPLGTGIKGNAFPPQRVYQLVTHNDELYAAGDFTSAGGVAANLVARWDGVAWSPLGSGLSGGDQIVLDLVSLGDHLYAGGNFTTAGGEAAANIARWDGSNWMALGTGVNGTVAALTVAENMLYVGGDFTSAGSVAAERFATWDGNSWSAFSSGFENGTVRSIAVRGSTLYAGGRFTANGGNQSGGIAILEGSDWSLISPDLLDVLTNRPEVNALAVSDEALYAGGRFTKIEEVAANNIARWNGSAWSSLGNGVNERVDSIALSGSTVYAGGRFTMAGDEEAIGIAR